MRYALLLCLGLIGVGCNDYDSPPKITVTDLKDGILPNPAAPVTLVFHEPVAADTLKVRLLRLETGPEGDLVPDAEEFFDSVDQEGGTGELSADRKSYSITLFRTLPVGPQLVIEVKAGLADDDGHRWNVDQLIKFGFEFKCGEEGMMMATTFPSAAHFMVATVDEPLKTQLQLLADIRVDPDTATFIGQFSNADRDPATDCSPFGISCAAEEVCRTRPDPACVNPSEEAVTPDEYVDYIHNAEGETGYSFTVKGCVQDQEDGTWVFSNQPVDVIVTSPPVTVKGITFNASFRYDEENVLRGEGTFSALDTLLGTTSSGAAAGTVAMRDIPTDEIKPGLPPPPEP